jgi:hypothetical protein
MPEDADRLDPAHVAPVVVFLASDDCDLNGQVLAVAGGTVARTFSATTRGWRTSPGNPVTAEAVRDNLEQILDPVGAAMPANVQEEKRHLLAPDDRGGPLPAGVGAGGRREGNGADG